MKSDSETLVYLLLKQASDIILGKERELKLALCCFLAGGHLLIEDQPGMGKTTLAKTFAKLLGLKFNRIQFTSDLLPADLLGVSIFNDETHRFEFHAGPIFAEFVLGDELNRASPKTQSACLQAMEESQVTIDGKTHDLPRPFLFIATQNPNQSLGTFPLPTSQLDRFFMKIELGFPSESAERQLLLGEQLSESRLKLIHKLEPLLNASSLVALQAECERIRIAEPVIQYILNLVRESRKSSTSDHHGLSPRVGVDLMNAAKVWAFLEGRDYVIPEDVQAVFVPVTRHRFGGEAENGLEIAHALLGRIPIL